jgi:alpha-ribazole phosphatase
MIEKRLYFVRHGESVSNAGGVTMEHSAIPLTERGQAQAREVAARLPQNPAQVLTSPYVRARDTAAPYCQRVHLPAQIEPLLKEFSVLDPAMLEGMTGEERRPIANAYWERADPHVRMGAQAETFEEFSARVERFLNVLPKLPSESVLFGHGIWFGRLCWRLDGHAARDAQDMKAFRRFQQSMAMGNGAVYFLSADRSGRWSWALT